MKRSSDLSGHPIADLDPPLSVRSRNCLESAGIVTLEQLAAAKPGKLLAIRSFGKTCLRECQRVLRENGMDFESKPKSGLQDESEDAMSRALWLGREFLWQCKAVGVNYLKLLEVLSADAPASNGRAVEVPPDDGTED
jgi:hypothetical protein